MVFEANDENYSVSSDVALAKRGDIDAFKRLIDRYEYSLYIVARGILRHKEDIEDAVQETILKSFKGIVKLRDNELFKTWLIKIMVNQCTNILRDRKRVLFAPDTEWKNEVQSQSQIEFIDIINSLEEELRLVTLLFYYEDLPQKKIAQLLNIPEGTVRSRLFRARKLLKMLLLVENQ